MKESETGFPGWDPQYMYGDYYNEDYINKDAEPSPHENLPEVKMEFSKTHKGKKTPFGRWATMVNKDPSRRDEDIEYTLEEQLQIIRAEGE
jgi:hypothetical protein